MRLAVGWYREESDSEYLFGFGFAPQFSFNEEENVVLVSPACEGFEEDILCAGHIHTFHHAVKVRVQARLGVSTMKENHSIITNTYSAGPGNQVG